MYSRLSSHSQLSLKTQDQRIHDKSRVEHSIPEWVAEVLGLKTSPTKQP
jgi:hypothetical protein